jgi:hypothetical protein
LKTVVTLKKKKKKKAQAVLHLLEFGCSVVELFVGVVVAQHSTGGVNLQGLLLVTPVKLQVLLGVTVQSTT